MSDEYNSRRVIGKELNFDTNLTNNQNIISKPQHKAKEIPYEDTFLKVFMDVQNQQRMEKEKNNEKPKTR